MFALCFEQGMAIGSPSEKIRIDRSPLFEVCRSAGFVFWFVFITKEVIAASASFCF